MLRLGIPVCLGNDGMGNAMWAEWKEAYLMHKQAHRDPRRANGMDVVQMAIDNNRALAGVFWPEANGPTGRGRGGRRHLRRLPRHHAAERPATCPGTSSSASRAAW
jgi:hypothetical protein